jgi:hypothetical protein
VQRDARTASTCAPKSTRPSSGSGPRRMRHRSSDSCRGSGAAQRDGHRARSTPSPGRRPGQTCWCRSAGRSGRAPRRGRRRLRARRRRRGSPAAAGSHWAPAWLSTSPIFRLTPTVAAVSRGVSIGRTILPRWRTGSAPPIFDPSNACSERLALDRGRHCLSEQTSLESRRPCGQIGQCRHAGRRHQLRARSTVHGIPGAAGASRRIQA